MRIAVWHNLNSGGGKRALYDHVEGLVMRGHEVVSFCPDTVDQTYLPLSAIIEERVFPLKDKVKKRTKRIKYLNSYSYVIEKDKAIIEHCKECAEEIMVGNFDVLFANSSSFFCMSHIGRFVDLPKLIYLGEPNRKIYEANPTFLWRLPEKTSSVAKNIINKLGHYYKIYCYSKLAKEEYTSAKSYDIILVNSIFSRESILRSYNLEAKVCYLGINSSKFQQLNFTKEKYVLGLGQIVPNKKIERAILAVSKIPEEIRPPLYWIGNTPYYKYLDEMKSLAIKLNVIFNPLIYVKDDDLITYLNKASVMIYLPYLEPFGLAPLEANACGTGVVGISEGGVKETIEDGVNGYIVNDFDPHKIAQKLMLFTENLDFAKKIGESARNHVIKVWCMDNGIDNIENYLQNIVKNNYSDLKLI